MLRRMFEHKGDEIIGDWEGIIEISHDRLLHVSELLTVHGKFPTSLEFM
jgi:hypothetical protein